MTRTPATGSTFAPATAARSGPGAVIARQAIVNAQHRVIGCELFNRSMDRDAHTAASDVSLVFNALSHAGDEGLIGKMQIFVNCTHGSLAGGHLDLDNPDRVMLEIPPLGTPGADGGIAKLVTPSQACTIQLINLARRQASTGEIEAVLKRDAGLAFNLMRLVNSSGFGFTREVTSFGQAVMILGLKRLFRWAALLLTATRAGGTPSSVGSTAVVRGRLMELLALQKLSPEEADNAFVVGIFSLLDVMLGMPMPQAVALLRNAGPFAPYLTLAIACETGDAFTGAAAALGLGSPQISGAHLQALAWTNHQGQE